MAPDPSIIVVAFSLVVAKLVALVWPPGGEDVDVDDSRLLS